MRFRKKQCVARVPLRHPRLVEYCIRHSGGPLLVIISVYSDTGRRDRQRLVTHDVTRTLKRKCVLA